MAMTAKTLTARADNRSWEPVQLLGAGLSFYVISLAVYTGLRPDTALSVYNTHGISRVIAIGYVLAGVVIGLIAMASAVIRNSLRPMCHVAAYLLAYATLACFRIETTWVANIVSCLRFLAMSAVATGAWLYQMREECRAHQ